MKVCAEPKCPELTESTYCDEHRRARARVNDRRRGDWRQRGYDVAYEEARRQVLAEEDLCYLCGKPVDKTLPGTHRDGPTADHVVRRHDGGTNARSNLRLAHKRCNSSRHGGDKPKWQVGPRPRQPTSPEPEPPNRSVRSVPLG